MAGAKGTHENLKIECRLGFSIIQVGNRPLTHQNVYATMGREASRVVIGEEDRISFFGNSFDSVKIEFPTPNEIIISSRIHEPKGESRFWEELLRFEGKITGEQLWEGTWNCFPVDTRDDTVGFIRGTWVIESGE